MSANRAAAILVVDDRPEQRLSLAALLREVGDEVVEAASGRDALRQLLQREFALILLDINMPEMDGFETATLIRARKSSEHTPIIFVTASGDEGHAERGYSLGAVDFIVSPVDPQVLKAKVAVFLELFRKREESNRNAELLRHHAAQLRRLADAATAIHAAGSLEELLKSVADTAASIIGAQQVAVSIDAGGPDAPGPRSRCLVLRPERTALQRLTLHALVDAPARPVRMARAELDGLAFANDVGAGVPPLRGWLAAPLSSRGGHPLGWLQLSDKLDDDFTAEDEILLMQLAQMAAIAAENTLFSAAQEANRVKDQFLATLSHELRTPLQAILSWSQMLRDGPGDEPTLMRGLEVIERNARAQTRLIEDLLDVSRIISGKLVLKECALALADLLRDSVENAEPAARDKQIEIRIAHLDGATLRGDPDRLRQVMANLFSNAIKFTPEGGRIELSLVADGADAVVRLRDTGQGVAHEFLPHLFERFRQADGGTTRSHGGLGIGLAIVRHLTEMHGGTVHAESDGEGLGTTFVLRFPLADHAVGNVQAIERPSAHGAPGPNLDGVRVLLVEDDSDTRECLALALVQHGAWVVAVGTVGEALTAFDREPVHVLVSDLAMPGQDGFALIRHVRERSPDRGGCIPAAALSAHVRAEDRARAVLAGFDVHIPKPVEPAQLARAVQELASQSNG